MALAVLAIVVSVLFWRSHARQIARGSGHTEITSIGPKANGGVEYSPFTLDLRDVGQVRNPKGTNRPVLALPRMPLHIWVYLPMGSDSGEYKVSLTRNGKPLWLAKTEAHISNNRMLTEFTTNLTSYPPGRYALEFRSESGMRLSQDIHLEDPGNRE